MDPDTSSNGTESGSELICSTQEDYDYNLAYAVALEKYDFGLTAYKATQFNALVLHAYMFAMLADRIMAVKDKRTLRVFFATIAVSILGLVHVYLGNTVAWLYTFEGTAFYYLVRAVLYSLQAQLTVYLNYCRIDQALSRTGRPLVAKAFKLAVFLQFPITFASELVPGIRFVSTRIEEDALYNIALVNVDWVYGFLIDCAIGVYTAQALYTISAHSQGKDHLHFLIAHCARMALFLAADLIAATANIYPGNDDLSLTATVLWNIKALPIKPYLLITDMARVRAISTAMEETSAGDDTVGDKTGTRNSVKLKAVASAEFP
ncbi:hypothetical protein DFJ77DRAFT_456551 [Powellomyces hirtus]|nr:hypothetical protein DFJ77DRAFT_456551 [Powellomyces hirtus]